MIKSLFIAVVCLLIPFTSPAMEYLGVNAPGDLQITVFITDAPGFLGEWINTPPSHALNISTVTEAKPNQSVQAGFAITGFTKDEESKANLVVSVLVAAPDGSILLHSKKWAVYTEEITIDQGVIFADPFLGIENEPTDQKGIYKISATVTDELNGNKATDSTELHIN